MGSLDDEHEHEQEHEASPRREPTEEERGAFEEMLLGHDIEGARARAFHYAMTLTRKNETMSRQMADTAFSIAWERCAWDPERVSLGRYLVYIVRSEWSHDAEAGVTEREYGAEYVAEMEALYGPGDPSPEDATIERGERAESREEAVRELDLVRGTLQERGDTVGLQAIDFMLDDVFEPAEMARLSGRPVEEFYRAADRRARLVAKLRPRERDED